MALPASFLWGGALAAHQFEGGLEGTKKGLSVADVMTAGTRDIPRKITDGVVEGEYYPNHVGIDFYHRYKEDIALFAEMGFSVSGHRSAGRESSPTAMRKSPAKRDCSSMMMCSMNC